MTPSYRLVAVHELDKSLLDCWRNIQKTDEAFASPYFCPEFTIGVSTVRADVRVVVIENNGRPVGFFPHQRSALGMGKPVGGPFSDFHGVIAGTDAIWSIDGLMHSAKLSVWAYDHLVGHCKLFEENANSKDISPQIDLSQGYSAYEKNRREVGSDLIRKTQGLARKLSREIGEIRFVLHEPSALTQLIEWKSAQYQRSNPTGKDLVFTQNWTKALLNYINETQTPGFYGLCSALYVGEKMVAAHMGMRSYTRLHYWFPSYSLDFSKYSPGSILLLHLLESASKEGIQTVDLGKGMSQYKSTLMTGAVDLFEGAVEIEHSILGVARKIRRAAEQVNEKGGVISSALDIPLRAIKKIERLRRFR